MSQGVMKRIRWVMVGLAGLVLLAACTGASHEQAAPLLVVEETPVATVSVESTSSPELTVEIEPTEREYEIVTLLPPDAIRAIDDPTFYDVLGADLEYDPAEMVLGVDLNGEARAYPIGLLAQHEIVNDTV
ncbi:MAG: DUF3179 domain-containing (seleno)protein, partial [Anaerolineae bacterium]